jgi:RHS repeat-associated protein
VVSAAGLDAAQGYVYDHDSNRVAAATGTGSVSYAYDRTGQLLSLDDEGHDPELFAYDAWGNLTSAATDFDTLTAYEYDAADRLLSIDPPDATETTFAFDALGRHASSTTNSVTTSFAYLGSSEVAWQLDDGTSLVRSAVDADGGRLAIEADGVDGFSLADLHGNLAAAVNAADDTILSALRYDPYGLVVDDHDSGGGFPREWAFQGRLDISPDAANPLYEFSARFYAPVLGTFTQLDSYAGEVGDPRSLNRYLYAGANPWTLIDPSGHRFEEGPGGSGCRAPCTSTPAPQKGLDPVGGANRRGSSGSAGEGINANEDVWSWYLSEGELHACANGCRTPTWVAAAAGAFDAALPAAAIGAGYAAFCAVSAGIGCAAIGSTLLLAGAVGTAETVAYATDPTTSPEDSAYASGSLGGSVVFGLGGYKGGGGLRRATAPGRDAVTPLRIYAAEGRVVRTAEEGSLFPGSRGELYATDRMYGYGNIAQENLAIPAGGRRVAGYWNVPDEFAAQFVYRGRVRPFDPWAGGGTEWVWSGSIPLERLGAFHRIPWAANQ